MNYEEARQYITEAGKRGSVLGLQNITQLMEKLGNVQNELKLIHIAGTNGKGSTSAYISQILMEAGYRVGRYTSPAVFESLEIFSINNQIIEKKRYSEIMSKLKSAVDKMKDEGDTLPTSFEIETALAFEYFYEENCDIAIIETGLGGRYDATNVIKSPLLSVITSISMDHMQFLGNTLEEIAYNKAGIIKKDAPVITSIQEQQVYKVIKSEADKKAAEYVCTNEMLEEKYSESVSYFKYRSNDNNIYDLSTVMLGTFQKYNVANAVETAELLKKCGYKISTDNICAGINNAKWHGRFEKIFHNPDIYFDGGHNPGAAVNIRETLEIYFTNRKLVYIIGVLGDKDYEKVLSLTADKAYEIITITPPENARALDGNELLKTVKKYNGNAIYIDLLSEAVRRASDDAGLNGVVMIFGSLSYLGKIKEIVDANIQ